MGELMRRFQMIAAQPHKATLTGSNGVVTFTTNMVGQLAITAASGANVKVCGKNLFDGTGVLDGAWLNENTNEVASVAGGSSIYVPIRGGETYTISKVSSARFTASTTSELPAIGVPVTSTIINHTSSKTPITIETSATDKYIVAFVYRGSNDTKTKAEILESIQVEVGSSATSYEAYAESANQTSKVGTNTVIADSGAISVSYWAH